MVMPISDDNSDRRTTPVVNYAIIALNVLIFLLAQRMGTNDLVDEHAATTRMQSVVPFSRLGRNS
jgi:hypothetical protein